MEINFLGRGSAFNPKEGSNAGYFIQDDELFLIDVGEGVFAKLIEYNIFENIRQINIMITHTHSDHIGSIGSVIAYSNYVLNNPVNIILPKKAKHLSNIQNILDAFGVHQDWYNYVTEKRYDNKYQSFNSIRYVETTHVPMLSSYGLLFTTKEGIVYYSGDTNETRIIENLIDSGEKIDKVYIDSTNLNYENNPHLYIGLLKEKLPTDLVSKVYTMHFNNDECIKEASEYGFNVVKVLKKE